MSNNALSHRLKQMIVMIVFICICFVMPAFALSNTEGIQVYQHTLTPEHKLKLANDITRYRNADNIWDVLREEFTLPHYEENPAVREKIEWFLNNQDFLLRSATRAAPYLYYILQQVRIRHLPVELVLLPIIESGYNPFSRSNVGALGIWQLMPDTATGLGVKRDWWYDGRRDVIASTHAALNYLSYLQSFFEGNWLYAIGAYNTGEGNIQTAIKKNIREGRDAEFWSLPVAQQTRDYVPSLLALAVIISHPEKYPIYFPPVRNAPYLAQIEIRTPLNLKYAATLAGLSYKQLMQLNPGFNRNSTPNSPPYRVVLPIENVEQFSEGLSRSSPTTPSLEWIHYQVKTGDNLIAIAKKFSTTPTAIRQLNHLSKNTAVHRGLRLLIPAPPVSNEQDEQEDVVVAKANTLKNNTLVLASKRKTRSHDDNQLAENISGKYTLQPGDTIYMVRNKDTLDRIAKHFHITSAALQAANQLTSRKLQTGKQLVIPTHTHTLAFATAEAMQPGDTLYMVRKGDTLEKIATRYHTSVAALRLANLVDENSLIEGEKLVVPTHFSG